MSKKSLLICRVSKHGVEAFGGRSFKTLLDSCSSSPYLEVSLFDLVSDCHYLQVCNASVAADGVHDCRYSSIGISRETEQQLVSIVVMVMFEYLCRCVLRAAAVRRIHLTRFAALGRRTR